MVESIADLAFLDRLDLLGAPATQLATVGLLVVVGPLFLLVLVERRSGARRRVFPHTIVTEHLVDILVFLRCDEASGTCRATSTYLLMPALCLHVAADRAEERGRFSRRSCLSTVEVSRCLVFALLFISTRP